jgi:mono/diheme cytochrome c family protein
MEAGAVVVPDSATSPTPAQTFNALEPALVTSCGTCHGGVSTLPGVPQWLAGPNRYTTITTYPGIIVTDVSSSLLLTIGDTVQHSGGPGLGDGPPGYLRDKVTTWLEMEALAITSVPLAATPPFAIQNGGNTIDISKGGVKGASMSFTVAIYGSVITFTDMTIKAPAMTGLTIAHPIFAIVPAGGTPTADVGDSFSNLNETVPAGQSMPLGVGLFVLDVAATVGSDWAKSDLLEIQFTTLAPATVSDAGTGEGGEGGSSGGCKSVATYTADAVPAIMANTCLTCHQGENPGATAALDMTKVGTDNAAACAQALNRVNLADPANSDIILAPTGGVAAHPFKGASASFKTMMLLWIAKE